jgi:hypothetical protein
MRLSKLFNYILQLLVRIHKLNTDIVDICGQLFDFLVCHVKQLPCTVYPTF